MITRNFNLYLNAGHSVPLVINVNQYDSGEQWVFTLYNSDGTQYTPSTGAIVGIKSDGLGIINSGSVVDGKVVINETQQMTAAVGKAVFELLIDSQTHGTANFVVLVEEKPGNNADLSESDLSLLQEAIDATSPLPTGGSVGQVLTKTANGSAWSDAGTPTQEQVADAVSDWADEHITVSTGVVIDTSLSVAGAAADSKKVGDEITDLKSAIQSLSSIPTAVKRAMDTLFQNVAFKNDDVYTDELAVFHAWATAVNLVSISAVFTQTKPYYAYDSLDRLKEDLVVTATYSDETTSVISNYVLSGTLAVGTSAITVTYEGKTASFNVTVSNGFYYTPAMGLLSEQDFVTAEVVGNVTPSRITETIIDDYLRYYSPKTASNSYWEYLQMETSPANISNYGRYKLEFKAVNAGWFQASNTATKGNVFMALITPNDNGGVFGFARSASNSNPIKLKYTDDSTCKWGMDITTGVWHTAELIIENGTQTLKIDNNTVLEDATLGTGGITADYTNRFVFAASNTNPVEVHVRSFEFEVR